MIGDVGAPELLIILAIVVVLFGATRVADIGKGIGRGIREFRRELKEPEEKSVANPPENVKAIDSPAAADSSARLPPSFRH